MELIEGCALNPAMLYSNAYPHLNDSIVMSRSRRTTPIAGLTNSDSEKLDKQFAARRGRKWENDHLSPQTTTTPDFNMDSIYEHPRSGGWAFAKDGKIWFENSRWRDVKKWLRK